MLDNRNEGTGPSPEQKNRDAIRRERKKKGGKKKGSGPSPEQRNRDAIRRERDAKAKSTQRRHAQESAAHRRDVADMRARAAARRQAALKRKFETARERRLRLAGEFVTRWVDREKREVAASYRRWREGDDAASEWAGRDLSETVLPWLARIGGRFLDATARSAEMGTLSPDVERRVPSARVKPEDYLGGDAAVDPTARYHSEKESWVGMTRTASDFDQRMANLVAVLTFERPRYVSDVASKWPVDAQNGVFVALARGSELPTNAEEARLLYASELKQAEAAARRGMRETADQRRDRLIEERQSGKTAMSLHTMRRLIFDRWYEEENIGDLNPVTRTLRVGWQWLWWGVGHTGKADHRTDGGWWPGLLNAAVGVDSYVSRPVAARRALDSWHHLKPDERNRLLAAAREWSAGAGDLNELEIGFGGKTPAASKGDESYWRWARAMKLPERAEDTDLLWRWAYARGYSSRDFLDIARGRRSPDMASDMTLFDLGESLIYDPLNLFDVAPKGAVRTVAEFVFDYEGHAARAGRASAQWGQIAAGLQAKADLRGGRVASMERTFSRASDLMRSFADAREAYWLVAATRGIATANFAAGSNKLDEALELVVSKRDPADALSGSVRRARDFVARPVPPVTNSLERLVGITDLEGARYVEGAGFSRLGKTGNEALNKVRRTGKWMLKELSDEDRAHVIMFIRGKSVMNATVRLAGTALENAEFDFAWLASMIGEVKAARVAEWAELYRAAGPRTWRLLAYQDGRRVLDQAIALLRKGRWSMARFRDEVGSLVGDVTWPKNSNELRDFLANLEPTAARWDAETYFPMYDLDELRVPVGGEVGTVSLPPFMRSYGEARRLSEFYDMFKDGRFFEAIEARDIGVAAYRRRAMHAEVRLRAELDAPGSYERLVRPYFREALEERAGALDRLPERVRDFVRAASGMMRGEDNIRVLNAVYAAITDPKLSFDERRAALQMLSDKLTEPLMKVVQTGKSTIEEAERAHLRAFGLLDVPDDEAVALAAEAGFPVSSGFPSREEYLRAYHELRDRVRRAEKQSFFWEWTPEEKAAWDSGDWKAFSRVRGYTEEEIADYEALLKLEREGLTDEQFEELIDADELGMFIDPERHYDILAAAEAERVASAAPPTVRVRYIPARMLGDVRVSGLHAGRYVPDWLEDVAQPGPRAFRGVERAVSDEAGRIASAEGLVPGSAAFRERKVELVAEFEQSPDFKPVAVAVSPSENGLFAEGVDFIPATRLYWFDESAGAWKALVGRLPDLSVEDVVGDASAASAMVQRKYEEARAALEVEDELTVPIRELVRAKLGDPEFMDGDALLDFVDQTKRFTSAFDGAVKTVASWLAGRRSAYVAEQLDAFAAMLDEVGTLDPKEAAELLVVSAERRAIELGADYDALDEVFQLRMQGVREYLAERSFGPTVDMPPNMVVPSDEFGAVAVARYPEMRPGEVRNVGEAERTASLGAKRAEAVAAAQDPEWDVFRAGVLDTFVSLYPEEFTPEDADGIVDALRVLTSENPELSVIGHGWRERRGAMFDAVGEAGSGFSAAADGGPLIRMGVLWTPEELAVRAAEAEAGAHNLVSVVARGLGVKPSEVTYPQLVFGELAHELGHAWHWAPSRDASKVSDIDKVALQLAELEDLLAETGVMTYDEFALVMGLTGYDARYPYFTPRGDASALVGRVGPARQAELQRALTTVYRMLPDEAYADAFAQAALRRYLLGDAESVLPGAELAGSGSHETLAWRLATDNGTSYDDVAQELLRIDGLDRELRLLSAKRTRLRTVVRAQRKYAALVSALSRTEEGVEALVAARRALVEFGAADPRSWLALSPRDWERVAAAHLGEDELLDLDTFVMSKWGGLVRDVETPEQYAAMMVELYAPLLIEADRPAFEALWAGWMARDGFDSAADDLTGVVDALRVAYDAPSYTVEDVQAAMGRFADQFAAEASAGDEVGLLRASADAERAMYERSMQEAAVYEAALSKHMERYLGSDLGTFYDSLRSFSRAVEGGYEEQLDVIVGRMRYEAMRQTYDALQTVENEIHAFSEMAYALAVGNPLKRYRSMADVAELGRKLLRAYDYSLNVYRRVLLTTIGFPVGNMVDIGVKNALMGVDAKTMSKGVLSYWRSVLSRSGGTAGEDLMARAFEALPKVDKARGSDDVLGALLGGGIDHKIGDFFAVANSRSIDDKVVRNLTDGGFLTDWLGQPIVPVGSPMDAMLDAAGYGRKKWYTRWWQAWFDTYADDVEVFGRQVLYKDAFDKQLVRNLKEALPEHAAVIEEAAHMGADQRIRFLLGNQPVWQAIGLVKDEAAAQASAFAERVMLFTHIDYENLSPMQRYLKRLFLFPVYGAGNAQFWGLTFLMQPQWALRARRALEKGDERLKVRIGDYTFDLRYLFSPNKFMTNTTGPFSMIGMDPLTPLALLAGHIGWGQTVSYRGAFPVGDLLAQLSALSPAVRAAHGPAGPNAPQFIDGLVVSLLDLFGVDVKDKSMREEFDSRYAREMMFWAATHGDPSATGHLAQAEQEQAQFEVLKALAFFMFKVVVKRDGRKEWLDTHKVWDMAAERRKLAFASSRSYPQTDGVRRQHLFEATQAWREMTDAAVADVPGFLSAERAAKQQPYYDMDDRFRSSKLGAILSRRRSVDTADEERQALRRAKASLALAGYLKLQGERDRALKAGPQAGPERDALKAAYRTKLDRHVAKYPELQPIFARGDSRELAWDAYGDAGFNALVDKMMKLNRIADYDVRERWRRRLSARSERFARSFARRMAHDGYKVLDGEFPTLREFFDSKATPLEKRVSAFYNKPRKSGLQFYFDYWKAPKDIQAVIDAYRREKGKEPFKPPMNFGAHRGGWRNFGSGGGLARWNERHPALAAMFATKTTSFEQWWNLYLSLPLSEQETLNGYRKRRGKKPFPTGDAARRIDWSTWGAGKKTGSWHGVPWTVLNSYFAIPKVNKRARQQFLAKHPELDAAFDEYEEEQREARAAEQDRLLEEDAEVRTRYEFWVSQGQAQAARLARSAVISEGVSGEEAAPERKL